MCCTSSFLVGQGFAEDNINAKAGCDALGALGELGWYRIGAILRYQLPHYVIALLRLPFNSKGTILACNAALQQEEETKATATFYCSFLSHVSIQGYQNWTEPAGPTGSAWEPEHSPIGVLVLNTLH